MERPSAAPFQFSMPTAYSPRCLIVYYNTFLFLEFDPIKNNTFFSYCYYCISFDLLSRIRALMHLGPLPICVIINDPHSVHRVWNIFTQQLIYGRNDSVSSIRLSSVPNIKCLNVLVLLHVESTLLIQFFLFFFLSFNCLFMTTKHTSRYSYV